MCMTCIDVNIHCIFQVTRPDGINDELGYVTLDEPAAKQSDPTVLDLHLRAITKETTAKPVVCTYVYVCVRCGNVYAYKVRTKYVKVHSLNSVALLATMYIFAIHVRT